MTTPLDRLLRDPATRAGFDAIGEMPAADLRSLLLAVAAKRAADRSASDVLRQYENDRFCVSAPVDVVALAEAEATALRAATGAYEPVALSPLAPFGASSAMSAVPQNNVVTTMRLTEVAADPTNTLALEAAIRRRRLDATARLCAVQRVVRAQTFDEPGSFAHFTLLGLVAAGRDRGDRRFEIDELAGAIAALSAAARAVAGESTPVEARVSDLSGRLDEAELLAEQVGGVIDPDREHGRGYYEHLCFKLYVGGIEVGDGGSVPWTRPLLGNRKERLVIAGIGLDRLLR